MSPQSPHYAQRIVSLWGKWQSTSERRAGTIQAQHSYPGMLWVISCTTWVAVAEEPATHVPPPQMQQAAAGKIPFASVSVPYVSQSSGLVYPLTQPYPAVVIQPAWSVHSQAAVGAVVTLPSAVLAVSHALQSPFVLP